MLLACQPQTGRADNGAPPVARFLFNNKSSEDDIHHLKPKLVGTGYTNDRFGNENSAIYLYGHANSYINLGTSPLIKPRQGAISMWVLMEDVVYSGKGANVNPILLTKCADRDDFFEAYCIYYATESKRVSGGTSQDSLKQCSIYSKKPFKRFEWHHLVFCYDDYSIAFYQDGKLENRSIKTFETKFNPLDSVMVGSSANKKNDRYTNGIFDDIIFYDRVLSDAEVLELFHAPNPNKHKILLEWILKGLLFLCGLVLIYFFMRYRFNLRLKKEQQRLELANTLLKNELRVNRALMNPHFIFNSLNTLHHYILTHEESKASYYLVRFSKLIRKILDSNMSDTILLEQEIDLIESYLEIESMRFKEHIHYRLIKDEQVTPSAIVIPIMMLQPFIENSVWHGLRDKVGEKYITVTFSLQGQEYLECMIEDNGIGRPSQPSTSSKKSLATNFVMQRLALLNKINNLSCSLSIVDKPNGQGTIVRITLPILNKIQPHALTVDNH